MCLFGQIAITKKKKFKPAIANFSFLGASGNKLRAQNWHIMTCGLVEKGKKLSKTLKCQSAVAMGNAPTEARSLDPVSTNLSKNCFTLLLKNGKSVTIDAASLKLLYIY